MERPLPPDVHQLIEQLKSPDSGQRMSAATGLAKLDCHDERVIRALVKVYRDDPDRLVRGEAQYSISRLLGFPVRPPDDWAPVELAETILTDAQAPDTSQDTDLMSAETHAKALQTINVVFLVLVPLCCVLSIYAPEGGSFVPVFLFMAAILICILSYIILIFRPIHCQTPGCNGRMEKWMRPISAFKVELEYRCPICKSVYIREIFQPQGDYK